MLLSREPPRRRVVDLGRATPLTPRQREVLRWLGTGREDREIAAVLGVSYRTINHHCRCIYDKVGASSRLQAVVYGLRSGELKLEEIPE